jgi:O-antigen/teichoic acid export membrane protein
MLGFFGSDASVGIYSFAASLAEGFSQIPVVIQNNLDPIIGGYFAKSEEIKISQLAKKTRRIIYPIMGFICLGSIIGYFLISKYVFYKEDYFISLVAFSIMMIGVTINAGYRPLSGTIRQGGRPGAYTLFILCLVIGDALLNLLFIPRFGIYGASMVTALTYALEGVYLVLFVRKLFKIKI